MLDDSERHLRLLFANGAGLIELRWHADGRWRQRFIADASVDQAAAVARRLSVWADVYVGLLPRRRRGDGRSDLLDRGCPTTRGRLRRRRGDSARSSR